MAGTTKTGISKDTLPKAKIMKKVPVTSEEQVQALALDHIGQAVIGQTIYLKCLMIRRSTFKGNGKELSGKLYTIFSIFITI